MIEFEFKKTCPSCSDVIYFKNRMSLNYSLKNNSICNSCKDKKRPLTRTCPECCATITYTAKSSRYTAEKKKKLCKSCAIKKACQNPDLKKKKSERMMGSSNPMFGKVGVFYGKSHSSETKDKLRNIKLGKPIHTKESKEKISNFQKTNAPMRGKSVFSIWVGKYGLEIAHQKMEVMKAKQRVNSMGSNNPMFGKPSPKGSGNGYSGWYDNSYFRSLRELMFLIYAKRFKLNLKSLEHKKSGIPYIDYNGVTRTYFADYIVNDTYFVEIKPKKLWETPLNILKFEAAKLFCESNNLKLKIIDPTINSKIIKKLYKNGEIEFLEKYKTKVDEFYSGE